MADSALNRLSLRWWLALVLLAILGATFVSMGLWQLRRADERREVADQIDAGRRSAPVLIKRDINPDSVSAWQSATAAGRWLPGFSVLLDNRASQGRPGLWLAMPLQLTDGGVLLVLRGWLPRPIGSSAGTAEIDVPESPVSITGEIAVRVPRLYELAADAPLQFDKSAVVSGSDRVELSLVTAPRRQNLSLEDMSKAAGLSLLPFVLLQTGVDDSVHIDDHSLVRDWPEPSIDADKNIGYAIQWFSFSVIAFGALAVLLWRARRRRTI